MDQETELIRRNIETTREDLAENLGALEDKVKGVVSNVKNVSKNLNPVYHAENHPLLTVGVTIAAGAALGALLGRERTQIGAEGVLHRGESLFTRVRNSNTVRQFDHEINMIKNVALGVGIKAASNALKNAFPKISGEIDTVLESAEDKLGLRHEGHSHSDRQASRL